MYNLGGQIALITGAASGIGRAIALRLSAEGADVVAADLDGKAVQGLMEEIIGQGRRGLAIQADVSNEKDVERIFQEGLKNIGPIDILVITPALGPRV
jgi:3-oxoacyl-[acyl-carrier protein] reductase